MWAAKRRLGYILVILGFFVVLIFFVYQKYYSKDPTCFDNILNQNEDDIDCGGICDKVCPFRATTPNIIWSRALKIAPGLYNLLAKVENPNFDFRMKGTYIFRAYSKNNVLVEEVINDITLNPSQVKLVFEPTVNVGEKDISRVFFELLDEVKWDVHTPLEGNIRMKSRVLEDQDNTPKLTVVLENTNLRPVRDVKILVAIYNKNEVVIQTSSSFEEYIDRDMVIEKIFTWPIPFQDEVARIEVFVEEDIFNQ